MKREAKVVQTSSYNSDYVNRTTRLQNLNELPGGKHFQFMGAVEQAASVFFRRYGQQPSCFYLFRCYVLIPVPAEVK